MGPCVVDASVVAKWFLEEDSSADAQRLRNDYAANLVEVEAPSLLPYEVLNALRFADVFSPEEIQRIAEALDQFAIRLHALEGSLSRSTLEIATSADLTVYDASYAALAKILEATLYTADEELLRGAQGVVGAMHIGDYRTPEG